MLYCPEAEGATRISPGGFNPELSTQICAAGKASLDSVNEHKLEAYAYFTPSRVAAGSQRWFPHDLESSLDAQEFNAA
jgi:hypothetical protein